VAEELTSGALGKTSADVADDILRGSAGKKNLRDADFFEGRYVGFGDDATEKNHHVVHALVVEKGHQLRAKSIVGAAENRKADDVNVFLDGGGSDHLWCLAQAGINDFHSGVTQGAGDYFGAAVVAVEAGLGDEDANLFVWHTREEYCKAGQLNS
jgi:hypothetical protein